MGLLRPSTWSVEGFAQATYDALNPVYGEGAPLEFVAEAVAPIVPVATAAAAATGAAVETITDDWATKTSGFIADSPTYVSDALDFAAASEGGSTVKLAVPSFDFSQWARDMATPYAKAYVDWYETATPVERAVDVAQEIGTGIATETTDLITETIEATAVPIATIGETIVQPIAEETGDVLEGLILPAAIIGGAVLLLK